MNALSVAADAPLVRPDALEVAAGVMAGKVAVPRGGWLPGNGTTQSAREALEQAVLPALIRAPCVVDFSGGRDSSVILAVAMHVARREGLPPPVAYSRRFPLEPMADEARWQELVIGHLRLPDWERVELTEELDLIGDRAQRFLRRYGLLVPPVMYHQTLSFELAAGGSRLSGEGGDEVFENYRARRILAALGSPRRLLHRSQMESFVAAIAPPPVRPWLLWWRYLSDSPIPSRAWLRRDAFRRLARRYALQESSEPLSWARGLQWQIRRRHFIAMQRNRAVIAAAHNVLHADPFVDPSFVAALARSASVLGFANRTQAMTLVAGDLLPASLLARRSKAGFNRAYFTDISRVFAETWDGCGVDPKLVDPEALKYQWLKPIPPAPSFALLQSAWMAQQHIPVTGEASSRASAEKRARHPVGA